MTLPSRLRRPLPNLAALAVLFALTATAFGQGAILQGGPWTPGHAPMYVGQGGSQAVVQDSGTAGGGGPGVGLSELLVAARGNGTTTTPPYASQGTGPYGTRACLYDGPTTATAGYHYFCWDPNAQGGALIAIGAGGIASAQPLSFIVNGTTYPFPFVTGGIVGPGTTVVNDTACWNNLVGTLLKDCGAQVSASSNNVWTGTNNFTNTFLISGAAQTFPASGNLVGTSDAQALTNKSIAGSEINSGTVPIAQMPGFSGGDVSNSAGSGVMTIAANAVTNAKAAQAGTNTIKGNPTAGTANEQDMAVPSCSAAGSALQWTTNTGLSCGTLTNQSAGWGLAGTSTFTINTTQPPYGYDVPINLGLKSSAALSALTITLTGANGSNASASNPVLVPFRSTTLATGTPVWVAITGALNVVIPSAATLGTSNSVPFRIWIFLEYNSGTPELVVATCSITTTIYPCASWESTGVTTTTISGFATAAGTPYSAAGVSSDAVRIIGYCDFASGLATAGAWASACTTLQLMGPGVKRPGEVIQTVAPAFGTLTVVTFTTLAATNITAAITPTATMNLVRYSASTSVANNTGGSGVNGQMYRGSTAIGNLLKMISPTGNQPFSMTWTGYDNPASVSAQTYAIKGIAPGNTGSIPAVNTDSATEVLEEIMGALPAPANDNENPGVFALTG